MSKINMDWNYHLEKKPNILKNKYIYIYKHAVANQQLYRKGDLIKG